MKKLIFILLASLVFVSCENKQTPKVLDSNVYTKSDTNFEKDAKIDFSDPARIGGSSFGEFFISMIKTQNFDMAIKFTSKESIDKFGIDKIREKYKNFKFNYNLVQSSKSVDGDKITLMYSTTEYATGKLKTMTVVIENDSCKLVLPDKLEDFMK